MASFNWICPHCNRAQTVTDNRQSSVTGSVGIDGLAEGSLAVNRMSIGCSNPDCRKLTLHITIGADQGLDRWKVDPNRVIFSERLLPRGASKPQPEFIPEALREDYYEACLVRDLSPKSAATLARRCLQGMIRDFCGIQKGRLIDEINALNAAVQSGDVERGVTEESVRAIDHVRTIGNIGAHMEKDISVIVPVDPGEAQVLIELIEMLFDEWYIARETRRQRLQRIEQIAVDKAVARQGEVSEAKDGETNEATDK